jgi:hypothetical protein
MTPTNEIHTADVYHGKLSRGAYQRGVCLLTIDAYIPWVLLDMFYKNGKQPFTLDMRHFLKHGVSEAEVREALVELERNGFLTVDEGGAIHLAIL